MGKRAWSWLLTKSKPASQLSTKWPVLDVLRTQLGTHCGLKKQRARLKTRLSG